MASASTTERFDCTPEQLYAVIRDFARYPEFLSEVKTCEVVEQRGLQSVVEFSVSLIKNFRYRILVTESAPNHLEWTFESGDVFKTNDGSWHLESVGGQTEAKYAVDATFKLFVPGPVAKALVSVNLPNMMKAYRARVKELYGDAPVVGAKA